MARVNVDLELNSRIVARTIAEEIAVRSLNHEGALTLRFVTALGKGINREQILDRVYDNLAANGIDGVGHEVIALETVDPLEMYFILSVTEKVLKKEFPELYNKKDKRNLLHKEDLMNRWSDFLYEGKGIPEPVFPKS